MNKKIIKFNVFFFLVFIANLIYAQDSNSYVKTSKNSVIRVDSTTGAEVIAEVPAGTVLEKVAQAYDWYKVRLPRTTQAYVFAKYISDESICTATKLNMRHKADSASYVLGSIKQNEKVVILDTKGKWYKIRAYPFGYGWIHSKRVQKTTKPEELKIADTIITKPKPKASVETPKIIKPKIAQVKKTKVLRPKVVEKKIIKKPARKVKVVEPKIKTEEKEKDTKVITALDLDAIINKHKKLKKKISKKVDLSIKESKKVDFVEPKAVKKTLVKEPQVKEPVAVDKAPYSGKLKKARKTATPARFKLTHKKGYTLLHIPNAKAVKTLMNKEVDVWGEEVEDGPYTYVVVKRIKRVKK